MQLLYTLTAYPPSTGGAQFYTHLLVQQMCLQHSTQVISIWDKNRTDWLLGTTLHAPSQNLEYFIDGICVHRIGLSNIQKLQLVPFVLAYYPLMDVALPPIANVLANELKSIAKQADLIHNIRIGREGFSYASYKIARSRDVPFVFTPLHHPRWIGWRYRAYIKLYKMADLILALTDAEKKVLISLGVQEDRVFVTGMGPVLASNATPQHFLEKHDIDGPIILFLGQHYQYKGYRQVLQATESVWQKIPEAHFVFIGPPVGDSESVFQAVNDRRIHRLGKVDTQEKTDALAACNLLCVPSIQESFGGVYTEAWNFGKPVIGCNIPSVAEVITDGKDGYLVKQEKEDIADKIKYLLLNQSQAQLMGQNGRKKLRGRYTWQKLAQLTEQAYEKVLNG